MNAVAPPPPLDGLRVLDLSTVLAGPNCARYLGDFGADVIKIERPDGGDSLRNMAWRDPRDGTGLWWKLVNRNKRTVALDLKHDPDRAVFLRLVDEADVLVENFRPGNLERLGLGPEVLHARRPSLVITRVTGFGQTGPYAGRPGFATIAEVMSGLSSISGEPDGQPMLPAIALTDEVTGLVAAFATMVALHSGVGQVVDVSLLESLFQIMGPLISLYRLTGEMQPRLGTGLPYTVPRGTYRCADGKWVGAHLGNLAHEGVGAGGAFGEGLGIETTLFTAGLGGVGALEARHIGHLEQHRREARERRRLEAERRGVDREGVEVLGAAHAARVADAQVEQADVAHAVEVGANGVDVQAQGLGDLRRGPGRRRARELEVDGVAGVVPQRLQHVEPSVVAHDQRLHGESR